MSDKLPAELLWADGDHPSEVALAAYADGELALLTDEVVEHVDGCARCAGRVAEAALTAAAVQRSLESLGEVERAAVRPRLPVWALVAAVAAAAIAAVPGLVDRAGDVDPAAAAWWVTEGTPRVARAVLDVAKNAEGGGWMAHVATVLLVLVGVGLARAAREATEEERSA